MPNMPYVGDLDPVVIRQRARRQYDRLGVRCCTFSEWWHWYPQTLYSSIPILNYFCDESEVTWCHEMIKSGMCVRFSLVEKYEAEYEWRA